MEQMTLKIAGNDYPLGWSLSVYKKIKELTGISFYHIRASIFNEINEINSAIGKPPAYHGKLKPEEFSNHSVYYTYEEYNKALADYNIQFDLELTRRVTEHVDLDLAAAVFYAAANACNSRVELAEMEENMFIEDIKQTETKTGFQYLITQYITWTYTLGEKPEGQDAKKPLGGSLLARWIKFLST